MSRLWKMTIAISVVTVAALLMSWWSYLRPQVYKTVTSPDQSWSVTVLRQRSKIPLMEGVDVIVVVTDRNGRTLLKRATDNRDLWEDVDERYPDVICKDDEILLGPDYWDGRQSTYYRIAKRDLQ